MASHEEQPEPEAKKIGLENMIIEQDYYEAHPVIRFDTNNEQAYCLRQSSDCLYIEIYGLHILYAVFRKLKLLKVAKILSKQFVPY